MKTSIPLLASLSLFGLGYGRGASAEEFPALAFLQRATPKTAPRFEWPKRAEFERVWASPGPRVVRVARAALSGVVDGEARSTSGVLISLWPHGPTELGVRFEAGSRAQRSAAWGLLRPERWVIRSGSIDEGQLSLTAVGGTQHLDVTLAETSPDHAVVPSAWTDFAYATTLLTSEPDIYAARDGSPWDTPADWDVLEKRWEALPKLIERGPARAVEAEIAALLETKTPSGSEHWQTALTWARAHAPELALGIYRRWTPVGRCSMDTRPQEVAREYADLCWERGRLGCLLQLQVQIMGNQFSRVAYSSYGEAAHDPESTRLDDAGVDVERFFRGLTMRFAIDGPVGRELPPWRIGKAAARATPKGLRATFERIATDRSVDDYNRLRAAQVLVGLIAAERGTSYEDGLDAIDALDVPPTTKVFTELERAP